MTIRQHTVSSYEQEFETLNNNLVTLANKVRLAFGRALQTMMQHDTALAETLLQEDKLINKIQVETERLCYSMLALRQPVAIDLRTIVHSITIASMLEVMGDEICNICKRTIRMQKQPAKSLTPLMEELFDAGLEGTRKLEELLANKTSAGALELFAYDDLVDNLYTALYRDVLDRFKEGSESAPDAMHVLFAAKNIERTADHCTDIAQQVFQMLEGKKLKDHLYNS